MKEGDVVKISYVGRIEGSGELFDTTKKEVAEEEDAVNPKVNYKPIPIIVGGKMVAEGLDQKIQDMEMGEEEEVVVPPEEGFGERTGDLIKTFSEKKFKEEEMNPAPGMRVNLDGRMGRILSVNSGRVRVDLNHPLAGRTLSYEVKLEENVEGKENKIKAVAEYYFGEEPDIELKDDEVKIKVNENVNKQVREELRKKVEDFLDTEVEYEEVEKDEDQEKSK